MGTYNSIALTNRYRSYSPDESGRIDRHTNNAHIHRNYVVTSMSSLLQGGSTKKIVCMQRKSGRFTSLFSLNHYRYLKRLTVNPWTLLGWLREVLLVSCTSVDSGIHARLVSYFRLFIFATSCPSKRRPMDKVSCYRG